MNFKTKLVIGSLIIIAVMSSYGLFVNEIKKIPFNYELISEQEGQDRILESIGGKLSEPFWIRETLKENALNATGNILKINSVVIGINSATNQIIFDNVHTFFVDRTTRKHQSSDEYFTFPPNVQKKDYQFFHPMIFTTTTFVFEREDNINGLDVYDFSCKYNGIDVSSAFPQFPSKKILSNGKCTVSVEPVTGMVVSFSKEWDDYFVNDGVRGDQVELGGKHTTNYSKTILTNSAKSMKELYFLLDMLFPSLIAIIGSITLFVILLFEKIKKQSTIIMQAQNDLIKKEKLSVIGELTARISHDLRNPLSVIKLSVQGIELRINNKLDPKLEEYLPIINDAISRINHQISQVLGFVKTMPLDIKLTSIFKILEDSIRITHIPKNIVVKLPENDLSLMADKIQLSVAFSNILSNAVDAIGNNEGSIVIRAKNEKDHVILEFEDSGDGVSKENIERIFDPLFTTKQQGTGLGLSSVRAIIESHAGTISVKSPPTIFTISLPQSSNI